MRVVSGFSYKFQKPESDFFEILKILIKSERNVPCEASKLPPAHQTAAASLEGSIRTSADVRMHGEAIRCRSSERKISRCSECNTSDWADDWNRWEDEEMAELSEEILKQYVHTCIVNITKSEWLIENCSTYEMSVLPLKSIDII